jgi:hypothetical protein
VLFGTALGADFAHGFVDDALNLVRIDADVALPDVLDRALKHAPTDGVLDELGEIAFLHALGTEKGAQSQVGVLRNLDVPANGFFFHLAPMFR